MFELFCLFSIINDQSVQVTRATDLEFGLGTTGSLDGLLDTSGSGVLSPCNFKEVFDIGHLLRLKEEEGKSLAVSERRLKVINCWELF